MKDTMFTSTRITYKETKKPTIDEKINERVPQQPSMVNKILTQLALHREYITPHITAEVRTALEMLIMAGGNLQLDPYYTTNYNGQATQVRITIITNNPCFEQV